MPGETRDLDEGAVDESMVKWTLVSALGCGAAFAAASVAGAVIADVEPMAHLGPIGVLSVIGFTVGGLVGPLARGLVERRKER